MAKDTYVESILPDIVPISSLVPEPVSIDRFECQDHSSCEPKSSFMKTVSVMIRDIKIEIGSSASDEMITKIIMAVRYA